jgi:hypothetical protein
MCLKQHGYWDRLLLILFIAIRHPELVYSSTLHGSQILLMRKLSNSTGIMLHKVIKSYVWHTKTVKILQTFYCHFDKVSNKRHASKRREHFLMNLSFQKLQNVFPLNFETGAYIKNCRVNLISNCTCPTWGQDSGIALGYGLDDRGFESRQGLGFYLFTTASRPVLGPTQPPIQWVPRALSLAVKRPGRETDHSHLHPVPKSRMRGSIPPLPNTPSWRGA